MRLFDKRLTVVVGNYGSGKTELSVSLARCINKSEKTALVDLDIVNPYFRSGEHKALLESEGIRVLMPTFANTTVDIPALPAAIQSVFDVKEEHVVFDVGGDDTGAAALGRYVEFFQAEKTQLCCLFVINAMRPLTRTAEDIIDLMERVSKRARMAFTGLVNNTNLAGETTAQMVLDGQKIVEEVAAKTGVQQLLLTGEQAVLDLLPPLYAPLLFPIERVMKPQWMD